MLEGELIVAAEETGAQVLEQIAEGLTESAARDEARAQWQLDRLAEDAEEHQQGAEEAQERAEHAEDWAAGGMAEAGHEARVAGEAAKTAEETHSVKEAKDAAETAEEAAEKADAAADIAAASAAGAYHNAFVAKLNAVNAYDDYIEAQELFEEAQREINAKLALGLINAQEAEALAAAAEERAAAQLAKAAEAVEAAEKAKAAQQAVVDEAKAELKEELNKLDEVILSNGVNVAEKTVVAGVAEAALLATKAAVLAADMTVDYYQGNADQISGQIDELDTKIAESKAAIEKLEAELLLAGDKDYLVAKDALEKAKAGLAKAEQIKEEALLVQGVVFTAKGVEEAAAVLKQPRMAELQEKVVNGTANEDDVVKLTKKVLEGVDSYFLGDPHYTDVELDKNDFAANNAYYFSAKNSGKEVYFMAVVEDGVIKYYPAEKEYPTVSHGSEASYIPSDTNSRTYKDTDLQATVGESTLSVVAQKEGDTPTLYVVERGCKTDNHYKIEWDATKESFFYTNGESEKIFVTLRDVANPKYSADTDYAPIYDSNAVSDIWTAAFDPEPYIAKKQEQLDKAQENYKNVNDNLAKLFDQELEQEADRAALQEELEKLDAKLNGTLGQRVITALIKSSGPDVVDMVVSGDVDLTDLASLIANSRDAIKEELQGEEWMDILGDVADVKSGLDTISSAVRGVTDGDVKLDDVTNIIGLLTGNAMPVKMKQAIAHTIEELAEAERDKAVDELEQALKKAEEELVAQGKAVLLAEGKLAKEELLLLNALAAVEKAKLEEAKAQALEKQADQAAEAAEAARKALEELKNTPMDDTHVQEAKAAYEAAELAAVEAQQAADQARREAVAARILANKAAEDADAAKAAYQTLLYAQKRDWNALKKINRDIVGWLTIPGTDIDCPIMQGNDNEFYKTHSYEGKEDENGSIFLDTHCRADFGSTNTVLHGGKVFDILKNYLDEGYLNGHSTVEISTPSAEFSFKLNSAVSAPADDNSFMDQPTEGKMLTLTTLADDTGAQRIVVTGNAVG